MEGLDSGSETAPNSSVSIPSIARCEVHPDDVLHMFCATHASFICNSCILTKHRKCTHAPIAQRVRDTNQLYLLQADIKCIASLLENVNSLKEGRETDRNVLATSVKDCRTDVKKWRSRINDQLDEKERELDSCLESMETDLVSEIDGHIVSFERLMKDTQKQIESLTECKEADDEVIYVGRSKAKKVVGEMMIVLVGMEKELDQKRLVFAPSPNIERLLGDLKWLGGMVVCGNEKTADRDVDTLDATDDGKVSQRAGEDKQSDIEVGSGRISACTFLSDGTLILCDQDNCRLLHYSSGFKYIYELKLSTEPRDATDISNYEVAVTLPGIPIQFISIYAGFVKMFSGGLKLGSNITMHSEYFGIHHHSDRLYVTCHGSSDARREVVVLTLSGLVLRRIGHVGTGDMFLFDRPNYICVSPDGSRIYVSDEKAGKITCLSQDGNVLFRSKLDEVRTPRGLCMGSGGCLLVVGESSNNAVVLSEAGSVLCEIITEADGVERLRCVAFRPSDGALIVGMYRRSALKRFLLK